MTEPVPSDEELDHVWRAIFAETTLAEPPISAPRNLEHPMTPAVRAAVRAAHEFSASMPIRGPDDQGAFPCTYAGGLLQGGVPLVVADANVLRNDILYACRAERRTVLVTAANSGAIRLFCAVHVLEEVLEHSLEWTTGQHISHDAFLARWADEYIPLLRVVRPGDVPASLLGPTEAARLAVLMCVDPDDVPSATLSLALGAFFLTEDVPALKAVYGDTVDLARHHAWLDVLRAGGDAGQLATALLAAVLVLGGAGSGVAALLRWLVRTFSPWALVPIAGGVSLLGARASTQTRHKVRSGLAAAGSAFAHASGEYLAAIEQFRQAAPALPMWDELTGTNGRRAVLARACLSTLAHASSSNMSASELAEALPALHVGQDEQLVRETLRSHACFSQPFVGRWQVGHAQPPLECIEVASTESRER